MSNHYRLVLFSLQLFGNVYIAVACGNTVDLQNLEILIYQNTEFYRKRTTQDKLEINWKLYIFMIFYIAAAFLIRYVTCENNVDILDQYVSNYYVVYQFLCTDYVWDFLQNV